jgi:hypothetical protein
VIAVKIVGRTRYRDTGGEQTQLEPPQTFFAGAVGVSDERAHGHAARNGVRQFALNFLLIEAENYDRDRAFSASDPLKQRSNAIVRLYKQFHMDSISRK